MKYFLGIIVLLLVVFLFIGNSVKGLPVSGQSIVSAESFQTVKLSVVEGKYILEPSVLKENVPVRLEADLSSVRGCASSIVISELGVRKTFSSSADYVEFTPNKSGKFYITCSMNMYRGEFDVLDSNGRKSDYVQTSVVSGHTCSASGGCGGCGGAR